MDAARSPIEPLPLPDAAILAYAAKFGIAALHLITQPVGFPVQLGASQDVSEALAAARKTWPKGLDPPLLARCWWTHDARAAQQVVTLAIGCDLRRTVKEGPRLIASVAEVE